jgi:hypothetical protein
MNYFPLQATDYILWEEVTKMELNGRPHVFRMKTANTAVVWDVTSRSLMATIVIFVAADGFLGRYPTLRLESATSHPKDVNTRVAECSPS